MTNHEVWITPVPVAELDLPQGTCAKDFLEFNAEYTAEDAWQAYQDVRGWERLGYRAEVRTCPAPA